MASGPVSPADPEAGQRLRSLRAASRLTQDQVSALSGLHVRTVRALETGTIVRPHRTTVDLLARALGLDVSGHMQLLEMWGLTDISPVLPKHPPLRTEERSDLEAALGARAAESMPISVTERAIIDADGRLASRRTEETVVALVPGVQFRSVLYEPDEPGIDVVALHLSDVENGHVVRERVDREGRCKIFDLSLGRRLGIGESHILRYSVDVAPARAEHEWQRPAHDQVIGGFVRSPASFVLEIRFAAQGPIPRRCTQVFQARPTGPVRHVATLEASGDNAVHLALLNPKPGGHGIAWRW